MLEILRGGKEIEIVPLPAEIAGCKIEGLAPFELPGGQSGLLAVVDGADPAIACLALELALTERRR